MEQLLLLPFLLRGKESDQRYMYFKPWFGYKLIILHVLVRAGILRMLLLVYNIALGSLASE